MTVDLTRFFLPYHNPIRNFNTASVVSLALQKGIKAAETPKNHECLDTDKNISLKYFIYYTREIPKIFPILFFTLTGFGKKLCSRAFFLRSVSWRIWSLSLGYDVVKWINSFLYHDISIFRNIIWDTCMYISQLGLVNFIAFIWCLKFFNMLIKVVKFFVNKE